ncbi:MAG: hypothetical protein NVS3B20_26350 [Polyangiales bacterium]
MEYSRLASPKTCVLRTGSNASLTMTTMSFLNEGAAYVGTHDDNTKSVTGNTF